MDQISAQPVPVASAIEIGVAIPFGIAVGLGVLVAEIAVSTGIIRGISFGLSKLLG